jgi:apolipoprotein N-acyltransferase
MKMRFYLPLSVFGGVLYALGFPSFVMDFLATFNLGLEKIFILAPIAGFALLFISWDRVRTFWGRFLVFLLFSLGFNAFGFYWIPHVISEFGQIYFPFNNLIGLLFTFLILPHLLVFLLTRHFLYPRTQLRLSGQTLNILAAFLLTLLEYYIPQEFPAHIGHPWILLAPRLGLAALFGAPLFSFISFWASLSIASFVRERRTDFLCGAIFFVFLFTNILLPLPASETCEKPLSLRLVQANIGNHVKAMAMAGTQDVVDFMIKEQLDLSLLPSEKPLDLIIWPETAYPKEMSSEEFHRNLPGPNVLLDLIRTTNADLLVGGFDRMSTTDPFDEFETIANAAFLFDRNGFFRGHYHKMKLLNFGETLPFGPVNKIIGEIVPALSFFVHGKDKTLFQTSAGPTFMMGLCYEVLFSSLVRDYLNSTSIQANFMINLTNDSWYGPTAEPWQHLFLGKWRSVEFNLPIVRSTNTGVTTLILANGIQAKTLGLFTKGNLDFDLCAPERTPTLFQKWGFAGLIPIVLLLLGLALFFSTRRD